MVFVFLWFSRDFIFKIPAWIYSPNRISIAFYFAVDLYISVLLICYNICFHMSLLVDFNYVEIDVEIVVWHSTATR